MKSNVFVQKSTISFIRKVAYHYLGSHYRFWIDDIVQDVIIKLIYKNEKTHSTFDFSDSFIYTVTKNYCFDFMAKKVNNVKCTVPFEGNFDSVCSAYLQDEIDYKLLRKAILRLNERDQKLIKLKYFFGCNTAEIAEFMHIPQNSLGVYLQRARQNLKTIYSYLKNDHC